MYAWAHASHLLSALPLSSGYPFKSRRVDNVETSLIFGQQMRFLELQKLVQLQHIFREVGCETHFWDSFPQVGDFEKTVFSNNSKKNSMTHFISSSAGWKLLFDWIRNDKMLFAFLLSRKIPKAEKKNKRRMRCVRVCYMLLTILLVSLRSLDPTIKKSHWKWQQMSNWTASSHLSWHLVIDFMFEAWVVICSRRFLKQWSLIRLNDLWCK